MKPADTNAIAYLVKRPPATIRRWAHNGWLTRIGYDPQGRALYDPEQAVQIAARLIDKRPDMGEHQTDSRGSMSDA